MAQRAPGPLDDPTPRKRPLLSNPLSGDTFGRGAEAFARAMGTPAFLVCMTIFCAVWLTWNTLAPTSLQFDPKALNYTLLTLILSLQASYAAPLLLLAQNRQDDRDRVQAEQDRQSNERNHATTDFITRDFVRGELRDLLEDLEEKSPGSDARAEASALGGTQPPAQVRDRLPEQLREELRAVLRDEVRAALAEERAAGRSSDDE
jgi:uncharacterized membrane protein